MALCHRLWGCNDFKYILKQVPEDIIPSWPEESVWPNTMHTFHLHMCFICAKDDAWIELLIISEHASLPNQLWTKKKEVASLFVLCTGAIAKKVQHRHLWICGLKVIQHWIEVLPYCRRAFMSAGRDCAEAYRLWFSTNIQLPCM